MTHRYHAVFTMAAPLRRAGKHVLSSIGRAERRSVWFRQPAMVKSRRDALGDRPPLDAANLERIYRVEGPRLVRYFGRHLPSGQDALDFVHEAFLRFTIAPPGQALREPGAYLQRIARNLLIDRSRRPEARLAELHVPIGSECEISEPARQEQEIELQDMMRQYRQALNELPPRTREVFLLQRVHDLTYQEIAERIGISVPTVQYHVARALVHLDHRLERS